LYSLSDGKQRRKNLRYFLRCSRRRIERLAMSNEAHFELAADNLEQFRQGRLIGECATV
jgi:hypothetical protein